MEELSETQRDILKCISDGSVYNPSAWPLIDDATNTAGVIRYLWDIAWLYGKELIEVAEDDGTSVWIRITQKGKTELMRED